MNKVSKSPWLLHYDASSCNGCDIEVLDCLTPKYDIERFGIINTGDPFQADILLITGGVNSQTESVVKQLYSQMPEPKVVVAVGICACTGGIFKECYNIRGDGLQERDKEDHQSTVFPRDRTDESRQLAPGPDLCGLS